MFTSLPSLHHLAHPATHPPRTHRHTYSATLGWNSSRQRVGLGSVTRQHGQQTAWTALLYRRDQGLPTRHDAAPRSYYRPQITSTQMRSALCPSHSAAAVTMGVDTVDTYRQAPASRLTGHDPVLRYHLVLPGTLIQNASTVCESSPRLRKLSDNRLLIQLVWNRRVHL